jgi:Flp pilus assembly protein TadD
VPEAISQFGRAIQLEPRSPVALNDLAVGLSNDPGRRSDAEKQLERAIDLRPNDALTQSNLGLILLGDSDGPSKAVPHFLQALVADPNDVAAHLGLAKALALPPFSDAKAAAEHLNTARQLEPDPDQLRRSESPRIDYGEDRSGVAATFQD